MKGKWLARWLAPKAHYISTYCIHGEHQACRLICKVCGGDCRCKCHGWVDPTDMELS